MTNEKNHCIHCSVENCAYHAQDTDYCTLDSIRIGGRDEHASMKEDTDCESFCCRSSDCGCR